MPQSTMLRVVDCISQTTRYPVKLLQPTADLEIDLGIDSVKRVEIVVALGKEFGLALADQPRDKSIRTIADIATWVEKMQGDGAATSPAQSTPAKLPHPQSLRSHRHKPLERPLLATTLHLPSNSPLQPQLRNRLSLLLVNSTVIVTAMVMDITMSSTTMAKPSDTTTFTRLVCNAIPHKCSQPETTDHSLEKSPLSRDQGAVLEKSSRGCYRLAAQR